MVTIIEKKEDAGGAECIDFKVDRSFREPDRILGKWQHPLEELGGLVSIPQNDFNGTVDEEFKKVVTFAECHGIPFILVNDREGLYPAARRPSWRPLVSS